MSYDTRCHELAQVFLADAMPVSDRAARLADELAQEIQDVIEAFMRREESWAHAADSREQKPG